MELRVGTASAKQGERAFGVIEAGTLADGAPVEIPVVIINGGSTGKRLFVGAAVHGVEVNPMEALRRVVLEIDPAAVTGQIVAVIVTNILAFRHHTRRTPFDNEDMNRVWPGNPAGTISERMAHAVYEQAVKGSDMLIDLHTGYSTMVTHTVFGEGDAASEELARVFGTEYLLMEEQDEEWRQSRFAGKLRNVAAAEGIPAITPELGGFSRFEGNQIQSGVLGLWNVLGHYGFYRCDVVRPGRQVLIRNHLTRVLANHGGVFVPTVRPGNDVWETQELGFIYSPRDFSVVETVRAPFDAIVVFHAEDPVVNTGDTVFNLGKRDRPAS